MREFPIITKLGGREQVFSLLRGLEIATTPRTVDMWCKRGQISAEGMRALMRLAEEASIAVCANDFELPSLNDRDCLKSSQPMEATMRAAGESSAT